MSLASSSGATGDHLVGQIGGVDGVYQSLRIGISEEHNLVQSGDREVQKGTLA
jgi:hypothetical protein